MAEGVKSERTCEGVATVAGAGQLFFRLLLVHAGVDHVDLRETARQ